MTDGERLARLEVEVKHLVAAVAKLTTSQERTNDLINQARGARYVVIALWMGFGGGVATVLLKLLSLAGFKLGS